MSAPSRRVAAATLAWLPAAAGLALEPAELRRLFPSEAEVTVERPGLSRLVLPQEILTACRPDLSDVRLFDGDGREIPYLVDRASDAESVEVTQSVEPQPLGLQRSEERRESGPALRHERYEIGLPRAAPQTGSWALTIESARREFVARVRIDGLDAAGASRTLVAEGSVFRLAGQRPASQLRLALPPFAGDRLRIELVSEEPAWIEPSFRLESARSIERGGRLEIPLETVATRSAEGKSVIELARPRGVVPDLLRIETGTPTFDRRVDAWDDGPGAAAGMLGSAELFRVEGIAPVGIFELELRAARGDRLRVEIHDRDSPPLADVRWIAIVRQPALIFSTRGSATLRFGGGRAHRPRYDLAGLLPRRATGERAEAAAALYDAAAVSPARLGQVRSSPDYDGAPALAFAMRPGAEVDRGPFRRVRRLRVPESPEGLSRLVLAPEDLAVLRADLADLRVADEDSRQWPFLIERNAVDTLVPLRVQGPRVTGRESRYALEPPLERLELERLVLDADSPYFDRAYRLLGLLADGEERRIAGGRIVRPIDDPRPIAVELPPSRVASLILEIEDGDDAPLAFRSVQARAVVPALYLTAPAGEYRLLLGVPEYDAARYELERVRDVVLAVRAAEVEAGALQDNPDFSLAARLEGSGLRQSVLLWATLIVAVVVLGAYTLRLARREP